MNPSTSGSALELGAEPRFFARIDVSVLTRLLFTAYTLPPDKLAKAIEYARARNRLYFIAAVYGFLVLAGIIYWKIGPLYRAWAERVTRRRILQAYIFAPLLLLTIDLFELPVSMRYHQLAREVRPVHRALGSVALGLDQRRSHQSRRGRLRGVAAVRDHSPESAAMVVLRLAGSHPAGDSRRVRDAADYRAALLSLHAARQRRIPRSPRSSRR